MKEWREIAAQIHIYPWSVGNQQETKNIAEGEISFDFFGSPVISISKQAKVVLPRRYEKFFPLGPEYPPKRKENILYEMPHGVISGQDKGCRIEIVGGSEKFSVNFMGQNVEKRLQRDKLSGISKESDLARTVLSWSQAYDDLLDQSLKHWKRQDRIPWAFIIDFINDLSSEKNGPRRALIVGIAEKMRASLPIIVSALRKILHRERRLMPINRISEMDGACLKHYIQQPGRTTAEKAGSRQCLLGIARYESYDVQENRILKDFLNRCTRESRRYIQTEVGERFANTKRGETVQKFGALCWSLYRDPLLRNISRPIPGTPPNYALLNDPRYVEIWKWYRRLLRREDDEDSLWDWQSRTWADIVRLLVGASLVKLTRENNPNLKVEEIAEAALRVRRHQFQGSRIWAGTEPGPFLVKKLENGVTKSRAVLEIVHSEQAFEHPTAGMLGQTGGHLVLVLHPLEKGAEERKKVLIVWALNTAGTKRVTGQDELKLIGRSARQGINLHHRSLSFYRLEGLPEQMDGAVVCGDLFEDEPDAVFADNETATVLRVPAKPERWKTSLDWIAVVLEEILGGLL